MIQNLLAQFSLKVKNYFGKDLDFKEVAKGSSIAFLVNLIGLIIGYLFVILVSKIYKNSTATVYGEYVLVTILLRIGSIITRFGTDTTMLQLTSAFSTKKLWGNIIEVNRKLLSLLLIFGVIVTLITILLYKHWAILMKLPGKMVLISSVFIIPMALGLYFSQCLRGLKKIGISTFLRSSSLPVLNFILLPLCLLFVPKNSSEFNSLPIYTFFASVMITGVIGLIYYLNEFSGKHTTELLHDHAENRSLGQLFYSSYPLLFAESMVFIGTYIDQLLIGVMGNTKDVAIFNVCIKYSMVTSLSLQAVNTISAPKFSEFFFKKDYTGLKKNVQKSTRFIFWSAIPIVIVYFMFPKFLLGIFGKSFISGWIAFLILTVGALVNVMTGSVGTLLQMTGYQKVMQNIIFITVIIEVFLNVILIPLFGVTGAAIASTICSIIRNFTMVIFVKKYFGFNTAGKLF